MAGIVKSITIESFRGIYFGEVSGFKKLNVIIGRNGTGKSSFLEALYLANAPLKDMIGIVTLNRLCTRRGWIGLPSVYGLFYKGFGDTEKALQGFRVFVRFTNGSYEQVSVKHESVTDDEIAILSKRGLNVSKFTCLTINASGVYKHKYKFCIDDNGEYSIVELEKPRGNLTPSLLIDWNLAIKYGDPEKLYSVLIARYGIMFKKTLLNILREFTGIESIELLEENGRTTLYALFRDYGIPVYYLSDGVKYTVINLMLLSVLRNGIVLIEEPEVHQHRRLLEILIEAIIKSVHRYNNQVFISTHSLELIDILTDCANSYGIGGETIGFYRLRLDNGKLETVVYEYDVVERLRKDLEYDFRG